MKIPSKIHFVGVGGIGMSGLAQMLKWLGCDVSGSDRDMDKPENSRIIGSLRNCGIRLFPQDGSFISDGKPDAMIYSTAIENDNPDFKAGSEIPKFHRAAALSSAITSMKGVTSVAVTGTCGKTTVTSWLAETLVKTGHDPAMLSGGLVNSFASAEFAGNFRPGKGKFFIYEADESDKSLLAFNPDYSLILNIGNDHYPINELADVFRKFIGSTSKGAVIEESVAEYIGELDGGRIRHSVFGSGAKCGWRLLSYRTENKIPTAVIEDKSRGIRISLALPSPGLHMAMNAVSVLATLEMLGLYDPDCHRHISSFGGVWRRFNIKGRLPTGALVIDDYAHNPEKIGSCIRTAKEITAGRLFAVFQPHGFGPLKFMKDNLFKELEKVISKEDKFIFLPVFYAGGTTAFSPTSEEVVSEFDLKAEGNFLFFKNRDHLEKYLKSETCADDTVAVMGARDNSLSTWTEKILNS
ncbi:MAG: Mur ligase domain-containing protein [Victivallales bacterium]|jgi:UDP-N-acetylmuramate--alanine ligase